MIVAPDFMRRQNVEKLSTERYLEVLRAADQRGNQDDKVSQEELTSYKSHLDGIRYIQRDIPHEERQLATQYMLDQFHYFANNRGLPPGQPRTQEFRVGEDDHIRANEVEAIAAQDGEPEYISASDLYPDFNQPPKPQPEPRPRPRPRPILPRPQFAPGQFRQFYLMLLRLLQQYFSRSGGAGFPPR